MAKYEKWITKEGLTLLEGWARQGLTDEQLSHNAGISRTTLHNWKKRFPEVDQAIKKGKEVIDFEVENALLKNALGYEYDEEENQVRYEGDKAYGTKKLLKKHQKPDTTAQIFWLKNRRPDIWRDRQEQAITGVIEGFNINITEDDIEDEEE